jgi:hypothetical protein
MIGLTTLVANFLGVGLVILPPSLLEDLAKALDDERHFLVVELVANVIAFFYLTFWTTFALLACFCKSFGKIFSNSFANSQRYKIYDFKKHSQDLKFSPCFKCFLKVA